jgi:ribonuclease R
MNLKEKVVNFFEVFDGKFKSEKFILNELNIDNSELKEFRKILEELLQIGYLVRKRSGFARAQNSFILRGKFTSIKGGGGFFIPDEEDYDDFFVKRENTFGAFDGDIVLCRISRRKESDSAKVVFIIKRTNKNIVGIVSQGYFLPFDGGEPIAVSSELNKNVAVASIDENGFLKEKIKAIGEPFNPETCIKAIEEKYFLKKEFEEAVDKEAMSYGTFFDEQWAEGRRDLRKISTITIDPKDAKDFDDAISVEKRKNGNFKIFVHIADVSFFVKEGSKLDNEARERGNSVYLPGRVYPMLPENLSNNLCSLNENEDKLCLTAEIELDGKGNIINSNFYESIIKSIKRLNYEEAEEIINGRSDFDDEVLRIVKEASEIASVLNKKRYENGALDFDLPEPHLNLKSDNIIESVFPEMRLKSHKLIEEFMLVANRAVAEFLDKNKTPFLYRIHEEPNKEKLQEIYPLLSVLGENLGQKVKNLSSKDLQKIIEKAKGKPYERLVNYKILRTMMKAKYSSRRICHYGLALKRYCHFTSPIRRYPDLVVHRALKKTFLGKYADLKGLEKLAEHLSVTEQKADDAEREAVNWLILIYLNNKIGDYFDALVTGFSNFGIKIELLSELIEGICPFNFVEDDHFILDRSGLSAKGKYTSRIIKIGQIVKVQLVKTDLFSKEAQFKIV